MNKMIGFLTLILLFSWSCKENKKTKSSGVTYEWKKLVKDFHELNEIKADKFKETFEGDLIYGSGKINSVENCSFTNFSKEYFTDCVSVELFDPSSNAKAFIYYPKSKSDQISKYNKGDTFNFDNCKGFMIHNFVVWSSVQCDAK